VEKTRFEQSVHIMANAADRRGALRSLGTLGVAALGALGLSGVTGAAKKWGQ
jgi:hypothetical protein